MFTHEEGDADGQRLILAQIATLGLASKRELAEAVGCHRTTLSRNAKRLTEGGVAAVRSPEIRG